MYRQVTCQVCLVQVEASMHLQCPSPSQMDKVVGGRLGPNTKLSPNTALSLLPQAPNHNSGTHTTHTTHTTHSTHNNTPSTTATRKQPEAHGIKKEKRIHYASTLQTPAHRKDTFSLFPLPMRLVGVGCSPGFDRRLPACADKRLWPTKGRGQQAAEALGES